MRFVVALCALVSGLCHAAEVSVAVAANFTAPMQKIVALFERDTGHKVVLSFGSTGRFYAQIANGAPFNILLSADDQTPARLEKEGLAVPGSRFTYAVGRLVLWSKQPGLVDAGGEVLRKGTFDKIAIADPKLAPYGTAAMETLARLGLQTSLSTRTVQGENITQVYQYVATGNVALGFVSLSQVMVNGKITQGSAWIVPATMHVELRQDTVLLTNAKANPAATALLAYLQSDKARAVIRSYGYEF